MFGAGCSYGTLGLYRSSFPPLARQFGSELVRRTRKSWNKKYAELAKVAAHLGKSLDSVSLEEIWTRIDYHAKFQGTFSKRWNTASAVTELKSALLQLYGRSCDRLATTLPLSRGYTLGRILKEMKSGDTLISLNYDTLVERLFGKRNNLRLLHCCGPPRTGVVRLLKPHGSASWNLHDLGRNINDGEPSLESLGRVSQQVEPLLLGAVPIKSELITEVQSHCRAPRVFEIVRNHWRGVADSIRDADRLVVVGYGFPQEDSYGRFFFAEGMRERKNGHLLRIEFYELPEREGITRCSIYEAFPGVSDVRYVGQVKAAPAR